MDLHSELELLDHSKQKREKFCLLLRTKTISVAEVLDVAEKINSTVSYKALWGLEFMCRDSIQNLLPHLDRFINLLPKIHLDSGVRPAAKICEYLIIEHYENNNIHTFSLDNRKAITSICFDWLITDQRVAPKAYSMTCLLHLGTEFKWIHPELKIILENNYVSQTAAYKARAREILQRL
ncbi:adenylosuccinate lyase [Aquimarina intermedia]|uniref:Adenylosuccinate lyase n=1 Tax=Aquimarina intermedia TaxID=350814 RepID=A0A5S5BZE1_9FLAO|nr:adenylosuccinate lyase [Aquimarina intermedia]TYP71718.1 hypothetical protein BD809_108129 [Aquimarina intermedia]